MAIANGQNLAATRFRGDTTLEAVHDGERVLRVGDRGPAITKVQRALIDAGFGLPRYGADGHFGQEMKAAVEAFQRDTGLTGRSVDGIVGSITMKSLDRRFSDAGRTGGTDVDVHGGSLRNAYNAFRKECECGEVLDNNCAHYLSDALIRVGFSELDGGSGSLFGRRNGRIVCRAGRPVRARELREWFEEMATETHRREPSDDGYWAVFQHDPEKYWGGHVLIHRHNGTGYSWRGTGDYPGWRNQEHYTW